MIEKEIKEYKQGNKTIQRINILKKDNITGKVNILEIQEYKQLKKEIKVLKEAINKYEKEIEHKNRKITNLEENKTKDQENIIHELKYANKLLDQQHETIKHHRETIKEINQQQYKNIEKLDKQHINQLKKTYDQFNKELQKYIAVNHLQNNALKQILELGFIDIIMNKHEKIAKQNIKEIDPKPVYELVEKKE